MTDKAFVLAQLRQYPQGRDAVQIISASFRERDCGVGAVHSRIAELRDEGFGIPPAAVEGRNRRGHPRYVYRLVSEPSDSPSAGVGAAAPRPLEQAIPALGEQLELIA